MSLGLRRIAFRWIVLGALGAAGVLAADCTTQFTLGDVGTSCDTDDQCKVPLACKCVVTLSGDDEGTDPILQDGTCQATTYICPKDGGVTDAPIVTQETGDETASGDAGAGDADATASETSGETSVDAAGEIAVDGAATSDATDSGETANDADAASEVSSDAVAVDAHD
jgi:hypothetical protein